MLAVTCDAIGSQVIIGDRSMLGLRNVADGTLLAYRCWCGEPGILVTHHDGSQTSGHVAVPAQVA